jgi:hypothetical protein
MELALRSAGCADVTATEQRMYRAGQVRGRSRVSFEISRRV